MRRDFYIKEQDLFLIKNLMILGTRGHGGGFQLFILNYMLTLVYTLRNSISWIVVGRFEKLSIKIFLIKIQKLYAIE